MKTAGMFLNFHLCFTHLAQMSYNTNSRYVCASCTDVNAAQQSHDTSLFFLVFRLLCLKFFAIVFFVSFVRKLRPQTSVKALLFVSSLTFEQERHGLEYLWNRWKITPTNRSTSFDTSEMQPFDSTCTPPLRKWSSFCVVILLSLALNNKNKNRAHTT